MTFDINANLFRGTSLDDSAAHTYKTGLLRRFERSPECKSLKSKGEEICWSEMMLEMGLQFCGLTPPGLGPEDLREILFVHCPAKVSCAPEDADGIIGELRQFFRFLQREFDLPHAADCLKVLTADRVVEELEAALDDPDSFGLAKSILRGSGHRRAKSVRRK